MSDLFDASVTDSGTDSGDTSSSPVTPSTDSTGGATETKLNPAWEPLMSELPEYFHDKAKGHLSKWDENYRKLESDYKATQEKYAPYEPYVGTDPVSLQNAMNVWDAINNEPKKVYDLLTEHLISLGLMPGPKDENTPDNEGEQLDPQFQEMQRRQADLDQRQQRIDQYIQQQDYNREVASHESAIDKQVRGVVEKYGNAVDIEDLMSRMFVQAQSGKGYNAEQAFNEQKATFQRLYQRQAQGRSAPQVIPNTGSPAPSGEIKPEDMNEDQRKAYFKYLLDIKNSGG